MHWICGPARPAWVEPAPDSTRIWFRTSDSAQPIGSLQASNGDLYVYGWVGHVSDVAPSQMMPLVLRVDPGGRILDTLEYRGDRFGRVASMVANDDVLAIVPTWTTVRDDTLALNRLQADGTWRTRCVVLDKVFGATLLSGGSHFLVPAPNGVVHRYGASCTVEWTYDMPGAGRLGDFAETASGDIIALGSLHGEEKDVVGIALLGPNGEERWRVAYMRRDGERTRALHVVALGEEIAIAGESGASLFVTRFDASGNVLWERDYTSGDVHVVALTGHPDGGLSVAYGRERRQHILDAEIFRLSPEGDCVWRIHFGDRVRNSRIRDLLVLQDGRLAAVGFVNRANQIGAFQDLLVEIYERP